MRNSNRLCNATAGGLRGTSALVAVVVLAGLVAAPPVACETELSWAKVQRQGSEALDANQFWVAEPNLKRALLLAEKFGPSDMRLAESLNELGRLYTIRGRFEEAEAYLEEGLSITRSILGDADDKTVPAMASMIRFYLAYGTASKAPTLSETMLAVVEGKMKEPRAKSPLKVKKNEPIVLEGWAGVAAPSVRDPLLDWAIACDSTGSAYEASGNFELAERFFKAALTLKTTVLGSKHLSIANSYDSLGMLSLSKGRYEEAEDYLRDSLEICQGILPPENPRVYAQLDKLAKCLIKSGKRKEAGNLYVRALGFWKNEKPKSGEESRCLFALGSIYVDDQRFEEAAPLLKQALEIAEEVHGPCSIKMVPYLQRYAYALYHLGRKPEMEQLKARADAISGAIQ